MKERNICKFSAPSIFNVLTTSCFVFETNVKHMIRKIKLDSNRIVLVICGEGSFEISGNEISYMPGDLIFAFAGEEISCRMKTQTEYMYIDFSGIRADELLNRFNISDKNRKFSNFDGTVPMWKESLSRANDLTIDLSSESVLLYTLSRLAISDKTKDNVVNKMLEITDDSFSDSNLSLKSIALKLSYNPKYLSQHFKKTMGIGYNEYLTNVRIKYAVTLFDTGLTSIKNVAILSGFSDPLYFSTVFKKTVGVPPKDYISK